MVSLEICGQGGVQAHSRSKKSPPSEVYVHRNTSRCLIRFTARFKKCSRRRNVTQNWTEERKGKQVVNAVVRVMGGGGRV